jgi:hypothetical protein
VHEKIPPGLTGHQVLSAAVATNVVPLVGLVLLWTHYPRLARVLIFVPLVVGFSAGGFEHFLSNRPDNVFRMAATEWTLPFAAGVVQHRNGRAGHVGRRHRELGTAGLDPLIVESALRDYQARQLRRASPEISGSGNSPRVCLGLFAAAEALGLGFVHGVPPVLYVERIEPELIRQLGISKERAEQPDLSLRIPANKESIFRSAVDQKGMPVSDALQVWLDVSNHPSRGKEQADRIRERILRPLLKQ